MENLVETLAKLSVDCWLWMDQVAHRPGMSDADVIATFPSVYTHCPVVVLLPGPECPFMKSKKERPCQLKSISYETSKEETVALFKHSGECTVVDSNRRWFERVWTRQEALYARRLRIVLAGGMSDSCRLRESTSPWPWKNEIIKAGFAFRNVVANLTEVLITKMNPPDELSESSSVTVAKGPIAVVAFFHGIQLVYANNTTSLIQSLSRLAETNRKTTDPKDLILSVWGGITFSPKNQLGRWETLYYEVSRYYEENLGALVPCGLVSGVTSDLPAHSLDPSALGQVPGAVPSVRSLYSPFQSGQVIGPARVGNQTYIYVSTESITLHPFPIPSSPREAIRAITRYTKDIPIWFLRTWWRCALSASDDTESEYLSACETEQRILVQGALVSFGGHPWAGVLRFVMIGIMQLIATVLPMFADVQFSGDVMAGLIVMCFIGAWGRDPKELAKCAAIADGINGYERVCVGRLGEYSIAFGKGRGYVYGVEEINDEARVRAVVPVPVHGPEGMRRCRVL